MTKFTDSIKQALAKKQAANHPESRSDDTKTTGSKRPGVVANKPQKKVTGRGR